MPRPHTGQQDDAWHDSRQLPTPHRSPEPGPAAVQGDARSHGSLQDVSNVCSTERRPSAHEDAILSDTSEKMRRIKRPGDTRRRSSVSDHDKVLRLSPRQIQELTGEPASIPIRVATPVPEDPPETETQESNRVLGVVLERLVPAAGAGEHDTRTRDANSQNRPRDKELVLIKTAAIDVPNGRPVLSARSVTSPSLIRRPSLSSRSRTQLRMQDGDEKKPSRLLPAFLSTDQKDGTATHKEIRETREPSSYSPAPLSLPLPPLSMPTFLSLELSANRPSPLYIYRPSSTDFPYELSEIKYQRLLNFLKIPFKIEGILGFGALACLDAWMHVLTILPLRFLLAIAILVRWWASVIVKEFRDLWGFVYTGLPRLWRRRKQNEVPTPLLTPAEEAPPPVSRKPSASAIFPASTGARQSNMPATSFKFPDPKDARSRRPRNLRFRHRRTKSTPSTLLPSHKADMLKGLLVIASCSILMRFDASRMYHGIRGQSAIKLYVIYNVLEVCDRLLSAVGQDVLECLFSRETLDRNPDGRSKIMRPLGMFALALVYTVAHATALFYQVITLNVAVNSYSNALLTLLMSNQFVEIKGTVFKKFEKENLFQITCADIVERFQLWLMLLIIAMRNVVEVGGLSIRSSATSWTAMFTGINGTAQTSFTASSIIPMSFTIFPRYIAQVLNPFLLVLGSEMFVDWLKHAYITKFNQYKPEVYSKFFDVLAKDYYSDAFSESNLTRRLGLPVIPLSCLFIRAAIQTYHMFIAMHMPPPLPVSSTSLSPDAAASSPATTAALAHIDHVFRRALGRSSFGAGIPSRAWHNFPSWSFDDVIAASTMLIVFLVGYLIFLAFKLVLGMLLLSLARKRYLGMQERELLNVETGGKRIGGWGVVDVDEEKRKHIYDDDPESLKRLRERDDKATKKEQQERDRGASFGHVSRYAMVAKRIW
ncbi:hypothetical protein ACN47E_003882 [Coniothyrium glycines]